MEYSSGDLTVRLNRLLCYIKEQLLRLGFALFLVVFILVTSLSDWIKEKLS